MRNLRCRCCATGLLVSFASLVSAQEPSCEISPLESFTIERIRLTQQPIFDETAEDSVFLHRWANALHINTKPFVVNERLPFDVGDSVNLSDLAEAEAILRREEYLANAQVYPVTNGTNPTTRDIVVNTQDNWSLYPVLSLSRSGGRNSSIIGVSDANFLGLGVGARFRYTNNEQRSGIQLSISSAVHFIRHANVALTLADNDDGERYQLVYNKPFFHLGTKSSQFLQLTTDQRVQDIFQNGETRNSLAIDSQFVRFAFGWRLHSDELSTARVSAGIEYIDTRFRFTADSPSSNSLFLAENRAYQYPWVAFELFQRNIVVMRDIRLINQPEDINLGWRYRVQFGLETNDVNAGDTFGYHVNASANRAFQLDKLVLLFDSQFNAIINTTAKDFLRFSSSLEAFYRKNDLVGFYARTTSDFTTGQFIDQPIVIDDDNGVRGYPLQYQHGQFRLSGSAETRFYTNYSLYQFFEVGFAVFADIGRAYGGERAQFNEEDGVLGSVGLGARFYSNKATNTGVIHVDFTLPLTRGENVDTLALSANLRRSF